MKKNRILYLGLFVLCLLFIYFYGGKVPYMLFYTIILLPVLSISLTLIAFLRFKYIQEVDKSNVVKGEEVNFSFSMHNEDFLLYPYIKINFCSSDTVFVEQFQSKSFSLLPFKKKTFSFKLACKYRGDYLIGIESIEFEDYLGIVKFNHKPFGTKQITVQPRLVKLDRLHIKTNFLSESHSILSNQYEDTTTIADIRKYAYGDSLKRIHWKLSSKMNQLLVKNFEGTSKTNSVIILDLKRNRYTFEQNAMIEDKLIECAVAIIYYLLSNWIPINLIYYRKGFNDLEAKNTLQFDDIYQTLSKVKFDEDIDVKDVLDIYVKNNSLKKTDILLFTLNLNYELYDEIYKAKLSGYDVNLIYVSPENVIGTCNTEINNILKELPEIGVTTYRIDIEDDIKMIFEHS
ncbi:MAG: DUF58 domain-containing protein [Bacillota bacterium]